MGIKNNNNNNSTNIMSLFAGFGGTGGTMNTEIVLSIAAYSVCSGSLLLLNKMTLHHLPYPSLVTLVQLVATLVIIYGMHLTIALPLDPLKWKYIVPYSYYIVAFALGVYCNMKSLSQSNVETVIVFKALSPCVVAFLDALFLGREYPERRSWGALAVIVLGAVGYASQDSKFQSQGYSAYAWPFAYLITISFEMAYGKSLLKSVDLKTQSGPVLYVNLLGIIPMLMFAALGNEFQTFSSDHFSTQTAAENAKPITSSACILLFLGCLAGTGIGYSSWWCRGKISATSFSLVGVMNKCLTILLNILVWDQHASAMGICCLGVCLIGGSMYRQAPMRKQKSLDARQAVALDNGSVFDDSKIVSDSNSNLLQAPLSSEDNSNDTTDEQTTLLMEEQAPDLEGSIKRRS